MTTLSLYARLSEEEISGLLPVLAEFVESQPLVAGIIAAVLLVLVLGVLRKAFNIALTVVAIIALVGGVVVYLVGPDQAKGYLEELRETGSELIESGGEVIDQVTNEG
jgi:hypothetical protein